MADVMLCENCGHAAKHHTGVGPKGYAAPPLKCIFETDRYEVCTCTQFKLNHKTALVAIVKAAEKEAGWSRW